MNKSIIAVVILLTFIFQVTVNAQYLRDLKLNENKTSSLVLTKSSDDLPKQPVMAGVLSFVVPGFAIGQIYNEQPIKALIHTSITLTCVVAAFLSAGHIHISMGGSTSNDDDSGVWPFLISVGVFAGNWVWSVVDAVISANIINKEAAKRKYRSDVLNKLKFGFILDKNKQLNLKIAFDL